MGRKVMPQIWRFFLHYLLISLLLLSCSTSVNSNTQASDVPTHKNNEDVVKFQSDMGKPVVVVVSEDEQDNNVYKSQIAADPNVVHAESDIMNEAVIVKTEEINEQINEDVVDNKIEVDSTAAEVLKAEVNNNIVDQVIDSSNVNPGMQNDEDQKKINLGILNQRLEKNDEYKQKLKHRRKIAHDQKLREDQKVEQEEKQDKTETKDAIKDDKVEVKENVDSSQSNEDKAEDKENINTKQVAEDNKESDETDKKASEPETQTDSEKPDVETKESESENEVSEEKTEEPETEEKEKEEKIEVKEETENPALEVDSIQSFEEWKKNQIKEEKEEEQINTDSGKVSKPVIRTKKTQVNYASPDCGSKILSSNPEAQHISAVLSENKDVYMLNPCSANIWFNVELCEAVQVQQIQLV